MKLKHFLSTALALVMVLSLSIPVFAADYSTAVSYDGTGTERYTLSVPSQLKPGTSGNVTLSGTWASNRHIAVTADKTVTMTGSLGGSETLDVTFADIDLAGDNEVAVSETKPVSVADLDALFGNWTGVFYYNVSADIDRNQAVEFTITQSNRAAVGYTGEDNENLVIPAYFVGDGENGTTEGQVYKVTNFDRGIITQDINGYSYKGAFSNCTNLSSVTIPESCSNTGALAFYGCSKLTSVTISEGVSTIGAYSFRKCSNLTSVTIPESVTNIAKGAFYSCSSLTSITIPKGVTNIGDYAFAYCNNLTSITFNGTQEQWNTITKGDNWNTDSGSYTIYCTDGNISKS